ncbi:TPA: hypothetical protein ACGXXK_000267 [Listeria monocytogenes]
MIYKHEEARQYREINFLDQFLEGHDVFIAGGCFKNIFNHEKVKDIDMFFRNETDFLTALHYYTKLSGKETPKIKHVYSTAKMVAFLHVPTNTRLELVRSTYGEPETIISNFDFTLTKVALTIDDEKMNLVIHPNFFEHLHLKRLVVDNKLDFPISSFERMIKYVGYGYKPCRETKLKIIDALNSIEKLDESELSASLYAGVD